MSVQGDLQAFLTTLAAGAEDQTVHITPDKIALQSGITRDKVNKTLNNLMTRKRIELLRGENGRTITGYRMLEPPPDKRRGGPPRAVVQERRLAEEATAQTNGTGTAKLPVHRRRNVYTPRVDEYVAQKKRFTLLTEELGDRVEASFRDDPLAEEALLLQERLNLVEDQLHDWRRRAEEAEQEVRALRTRHVQATTRRVAEAGAMVEHSSD